MSLDSSRSPRRQRRYLSRDRSLYRDVPYRRDQGHNRQDGLCKNCKRPGHFARECPNVAVCNNCGLPGHIAAECSSKTMCWNCKEPGHLANQCSNDPICHLCNTTGHLARACSESSDPRVCNNCFKTGHIAVDCTNGKACNNCRKTGHLARECSNDPVCNLCNVSGHVARQCPKTTIASQIVGGPFRDIICRNCGQPGHISRDCVSVVICNCCGGLGHIALECPSAARTVGRAYRMYWFYPQTTSTTVEAKATTLLCAHLLQSVDHLNRMFWVLQELCWFGWSCLWSSDKLTWTCLWSLFYAFHAFFLHLSPLVVWFWWPSYVLLNLVTSSNIMLLETVACLVYSPAWIW